MLSKTCNIPPALAAQVKIMAIFELLFTGNEANWPYNQIGSLIADYLKETPANGTSRGSKDHCKLWNMAE
jgi:hypothetical protein